MNIVLAWPPRALSPNARLHWSKVSPVKKAYRNDCAMQARSQGAHRLRAERLKVVITFYPPNRNRRDLDNCVASLKSGIDGLVDVLGVDDSKWTMSFVLASELGGMVRIEVQEVAS